MMTGRAAYRSGLLMALCGFALLTCGDAIVKSMTDEWPAPAIAALRFSVALPVLTLFVIRQQGSGGLRLTSRWWHLARGLTIAASSTLFFVSLGLMPLAAATAIAFVHPVLTALFSALILKEALHWRGWLSVGIALVGVVLVLRPNLAAIGLLALVPLASATLFSAFFLLNRHLAGTASAVAMQWSMALVCAPVLTMVAFAGKASGVEALAFSWPDWTIVARCAMVAVSATTCHWLIYLATVRTSAATIAPATYVQLPVALLIDAIVFRHFPDAMAMGGAALIVFAGVLLVLSRGAPAPVTATA